MMGDRRKRDRAVYDDRVTELRVSTERRFERLHNDVNNLAEQVRGSQAETEKGFQNVADRLDNVGAQIADLAALTATNLGKMETSIDRTTEKTRDVDFEAIRRQQKRSRILTRVWVFITALLSGEQRFRWILVVLAVLATLLFGTDVLKLFSVSAG